MKLIRKLCCFVLAVILCALFYTTSTGAVHAAPIAHTETPSISQPSTGSSTLVQRANPYVHIANHIATVNPAISQHLNANEVKLVQNAVKHYNSLPVSVRQQGTISGNFTLRTNGKVQPLGAVRYYCDWYWWGVRCWVSSAAAQNWALYGPIIATGIGFLVAGPLGAAVGVVSALILSVVGVLPATLDNNCGNRGMFIDIDWLLIVDFAPVC